MAHQEAKAEVEEAVEQVLDDEIRRHAEIGRAFSLFMSQFGGAVPAPSAMIPAAPKPVAAIEASKAAPAAPVGQSIKAPLTGTFYRSEAPSKPEFSKEGDAVKAGQAVCVIEAMKLFNPVKAEKGCKVVRFLVKPGDQVTKGQPIIEIE